MCSYNQNRWRQALGEANTLKVNGEMENEARLQFPQSKTASPKEERWHTAEMETQIDMQQRKLSMRPHHKNCV